MARNFEVKCPSCGTLVAVIERPMGVPGGKEREEANCPVCGEIVYTGITDGWFNTDVVSIEETVEPYKSTLVSQEKFNIRKKHRFTSCEVTKCH